MAKRASLIAKTVKKPRVSHSEAYLINRKYMGDELEFLGAMTEGEVAQACNWYNCMCDKSDAREYTETWLKSQGRLDEVKKFKSIPDEWVNLTCAWIARLLAKDYEVPAHSIEFFEKTFAYTLTKAKVQAESSTPRASVQDRMRERAHDIIGEIEEMIDAGEDFSVYDWLKAKEIPATYAPMIASYYAAPLTELIEAYEGKCPQLKEAYAYMTKKQLGERIKFYHNIVTDADKYAGVVKKTRTPSKPRAVSKEKLLKNFKYQKEDSAYKIASVNPEKVLGAQELWCFNTKNKVVTVFRALDRGGLNVKGASITGFDESTSLSKGAGRKPEIILEKIQKSGKIVLKKLMDELKTDKPLQARMNENTVLIKVV